MAPGRDKGKQHATAAPRTSSRRTVYSRNRPAVVSNVYDELLAEAAAAEPSEPTPPPPKRRRVVRETNETSGAASSSRPDSVAAGTHEPSDTGAHHERLPQTVEDSSEDESDFGFEDVDLDGPVPGSSKQDDDRIEDISVSINPATTPSGRSSVKAKRKPPTAAEKAVRMITHKAYVLSLLAHSIHVNSWCNNAVVQRVLLKMLSKKTKNYLTPDPSFTQFRRNESFMEGLDTALEAFNLRFSVTESSLRKPRWDRIGQDANSTDYEDAPRMDLSDFIVAAKRLEGSQDTGNQLFCALLRAAGAEARLVCSLQPLPFGTTEAKAPTPRKPKKPTIFAIAPDHDLSAGDASTDDGSVKSSASIGKVPSAKRRLGQPGFAPESAPKLLPEPQKKSLKLSYPVFWVEAFNEAHQKWIPLDPVVTNTLNKATKFEPPSNYPYNQLTYAIAFEDDGVARDVTRRYVKAYNAKTRQQRVESTGEDGTRWWKQVLRFFRRRGVLDRDQVEDAELSRKEASEGLPTNVQDFKSHPYYALERHLKRHEVLRPGHKEVGKVNAGTPAKPRMEPICRRSDVLVCKSADKWYRLGREIKPGEQPLKHVVARRSGKGRSLDEDEDEEEANVARTALYAPHQTLVYVPAPVVNGRVPRNGYGNLDIYVPSMIPPGGAHVRHASGQRAAKLLRLDYADAVTGFKFKGRQGTAVIEGIIVAVEYEEAVRAVIEGFEQEIQDDQYRARSLEALRQWKRFLIGLRIHERVNAYGDGKAVDVRDEIDKAEDEGDNNVEAGGFFPDEGADQVALPTAGRFALGETAATNDKKSRGKTKATPESDVESDEASEVEDEGCREAREPTRQLPKRAAAQRKVVYDVEEEEQEQEQEREREQERNEHPSEAEDRLKTEGGGFLPGDETTDPRSAAEQPTLDGDYWATQTNGGGFLPEGKGPGLLSGRVFADDAGDMDYEYEDGGFLVEDDESDTGRSTAMTQGAVDDHQRRKCDSSPLLPHVGTAQQEDMAQAVCTEERQAVERTPLDEAAVPDEALQIEEDPESSRQPLFLDAAAEDIVASKDMAPADESDSSKERSGREVPVNDVAMQDAEPVIAARDEGVAGEKAEEAEESSDKGSMLSHDPEDSDAEPDWLAGDE